MVDIVSPFDMDIIFLKGDTGGFCSDMLLVEISMEISVDWYSTDPHVLLEVPGASRSTSFSSFGVDR